MLVTVRVRPLTPREIATDPAETVKVFDHKMVVLLDSAGEDGEKRGRSREAQFSFDFVYDKVLMQPCRPSARNKFTTSLSRAC